MAYKFIDTQEEITPIQMKMEVVGCDLLNVREEPSITAKILYRLNKGDVITVVEDLGDWVEFEDGYLMKDYLKEV